MKLQRPTSKTLMLVCVIAIVVGALLIEIIAIAKRWDGLAREISFLVAFPALPLAIMAAFPHTARHIRTALYVLGCVIGLVVAIFLIRFAWLTRQEPVIKIGVSLPFRIDSADARPIYEGIKTAVDRMSGEGIRHINDHTLEMGHRLVELIPFDDSAIGDRDCRGARSCPITLSAGGKQEDFTDLAEDPRVIGIIGPFNSGVAVREIPAVTRARIPLISPTNAADCLTNPRFADGNCDVAKMGRGSYFRLATPDSVRQKALADYLWSTWQEQHRGTTPQVVIYAESGPRGETFSKGAAERFNEAWLRHTPVAPAVVPLANASSDADLKDSLNKLTFSPDIILYAGTGSAGARLYQAAAELGLSETIFAGPGSLENGEYARYINHPRGGRLYAVDFAAISSADASDTSGIPALQPPIMYSALAYDAARICLLAIQSVLHDQEHAVLDTFSFRTRLALAARPLDIGTESSFRQRVISKINWLNTGRDGGIEYHGVTGTYSFNDNDADGAPGVTIFTYDAVARAWNSVKIKAP